MRTPGNKRLSKEKRCCQWYSSGGNRTLAKKSPTDVQTPSSFFPLATHYGFQLYLI
jgi:hypothetical protein